MDEIDIWRAANLLIEQHGPQAILEAARRQVAMLENDDAEGAAVWARITLAISTLMSGKPAPHEVWQ
jgi:hypothetical protein